MSRQNDDFPKQNRSESITFANYAFRQLIQPKRTSIVTTKTTHTTQTPSEVA